MSRRQKSDRFFREVLKLNGGEHEGKPFILLPWQCFVIGSIFGWKMTDGTRGFAWCTLNQAKVQENHRWQVALGCIV